MPYSKVELSSVYSASSDYSNPVARFMPAAYAVTPDEFVHLQIQADTGGTAVTTSTLSAATALIVKNLDGTNYVTATFRSAGNSSTDNIIRIAAGAFLVVSDFTVANNLTLTANSAAVNCDVFIVGT